jgi:FkbM family methyltransferase
MEEPKSAADQLNRVLGRDGTLVAVDVGGAHGLQPHWHKLMGVSRFVVYEPHDQSYQNLLTQQSENADFKNFQYLNEALSGQAGPRTLYETNTPTGSSLLPPKKGGFGDYPGNDYFWPYKTSTIETTTLSRSLDRNSVGRIDIIKLDTQGTELEILTGLDSRRFDDVLAVEMEIALLDVYEGTDTLFDDTLRFMRDRGFSLFDLRTNRHLGNAVRLPADEVAKAIGNDTSLPPNAHRLAEVDAIFFRDPRLLISSSVDEAKVRRLVVLLVIYHFFAEAVYTIVNARDQKIIGAEAAAELLDAIRRLHIMFSRETQTVIEFVRRNAGQNWAQYMWVPYPSS